MTESLENAGRQSRFLNILGNFIGSSSSSKTNEDTKNVNTKTGPAPPTAVQVLVNDQAAADTFVAESGSDAEPVYEVHKIIGEMPDADTGEMLYCVRWKGFKKDMDTWEPLGNLEGCQNVLNAWEQKKHEKSEKKKARQEAKSSGPNKPKTNRATKSTKSAGPGRKATSLTQGRKRSRSNSSESDNRGSITKRPAIINPLTSEELERLQITDDLTSPTSLIDRTIDHPDRLRFLEKLRILSGPPITVANFVDNVPSPPLDFTFIKDYLFREGVPVPDPDFMWGCECKGAYGCVTTRPEDCSCGNESHELVKRLAYKHRGVLKYPEENSFAIHECTDKCKCNFRCPNRVVLKGRNVPLEIFKTEKKGWGIRCPIDLPAGQFIDRYVGEVVNGAEAERRGGIQESRGLTYLFDLDKFEEDMEEGSEIYCVDGAEFGGVTRFINHSCAPNLMIHAVTHNRSRLDIYDLALFTCRAVSAGEELTFEYRREEPGAEVPSDRRKWPCYCGASKCRGWLWS